MPLKDAVSFRALMMFSSACVGFCGAGPPPDFDLSFLFGIQHHRIRNTR
jgi:hypothetical protein